MPFMRDLYCSVCGRVQCDVMLDDAHQLVAELPCEQCASATEHLAICNGGTGSRYRFADFPTDPRFYRGQVEVDGHGATVGGNDVAPSAKFADPDRRGERRERHYWESDHKRGRTPLFYDGKRSR